jgi:hypothetical protein
MNPNRRFLLEVLGSGLELGVIKAEDVLRHVTPDILAHHLPVTLKVKLLEASLASERMTPTLVVETIGTDGLAEHAPIGALWACISECARRPVNELDDMTSGGAEGSELKPNKSARSSGVRMPSRISALSPRSRGASSAPRGGRTDDDGDDEFARQTREVTPEDETRPGDVTGRKA